jgi:hypothetical protein
MGQRSCMDIIATNMGHLPLRWYLLDAHLDVVIIHARLVFRDQEARNTFFSSPSN